jgi:phospholipid/cholesterol/gamma-HCH transport system substrate-binding protein
MSRLALLGAFMLVVLIILGVLILRIERIGFGDGEARNLLARFESVEGLDEGSPVRVAGVRVGYVEEVGLEDGEAVVRLAVVPGVEVREGATAQIRSEGMLGENYVAIQPGPTGAPELAGGAVIRGVPSTGFDDVLDTVGAVGGDVKQVTQSLRNVLGTPEGERRLEEILANIAELTAQTQQLVAENRTEVRETIGNFRDVSATLRDELPRLAEKMGRLADNIDALVADNRDEISGSLANVEEVTARLRTTADNLNDITGKIARGEGTIGKLVNEDETVENVNETLNAVESGIASLKETIGRPATWKLDVAMQTETLPDLDDSRSMFEFDLHTTDRRFYRVGLVDSPVGDTETTREVITVTDPQGNTEVTIQEREETTDDFTFNAQVGYRIGRTIFRAGLFESDGGVGVDRWMLDDKLGVTLEAYDFGREEDAPHLRFEGRYFVNDHIFGMAGWDDPTYSDNSSYFVGAGITWRDEDLKYLLGTAASLAN